MAQEHLLGLLLCRVQRLRGEYQKALGIDPNTVDKRSTETLPGETLAQLAEIDDYYKVLVDQTLTNVQERTRHRVRKVPTIITLTDEVRCGLEEKLEALHKPGPDDELSNPWDPDRPMAEDRNIEEARAHVDDLLDDLTDVKRETYCLEQIQISRKKILKLRCDFVVKLFTLRFEWMIQLLRTDETILSYIFRSPDKMNPQHIERDTKVFKKIRDRLKKIADKSISKEDFETAEKELINLTKRLKKEFDAMIRGFEKYQGAPGTLAKDGIPAWKAGLPNFLFTYFKEIVGRAMCAHDQRLKMEDNLIRREAKRLLRFEGEIDLIKKLREAVMDSEDEVEWLLRLESNGQRAMRDCELTRSDEMRKYLKSMGLDKLKLSSEVISAQNDYKASMKSEEKVDGQGYDTKIREQEETSNDASPAVAGVIDHPGSDGEGQSPAHNDGQPQLVDKEFLSKDEAIVGSHEDGSSANGKEGHVAGGEQEVDNGGVSTIKNKNPEGADVHSAPLTQEDLCREASERLEKVLTGFVPWEMDKIDIRTLWMAKTEDTSFTTEFGVRSRIIENLRRMNNERAHAAADEAMQQLRYEEFEVKRFLDQEKILKEQEAEKLKEGKDKRGDLLKSLEKVTSELADSKAKGWW